MSRKSPGPTAADYLVVVISPVLIMALVGSLVFFLVEILYAGQYEWRLKWILFFFVFGAVLIARISMLGEIAARAPLYGVVLGFLVFLGLQGFVEYPPGTPLAQASALINLALLGLIWWCAHRLTWDCTFIDESAEATGQGVLQAAGLEQPPAAADAETKEVSTEEEEGPVRPGWLERYRRYREEKRRRYTPGVWVVYFSLAALPLFGLGQALLPVGELGRRRYAFWLLGVYVASGLGLLLTTAFLGLRRYLRQRGLRMPATITGVWLSLGVTLIVALLVIGMLLPRPHPEYSPWSLARLGSPPRDASDHALMRDGSGKGDGRPSSDPSARETDKGEGRDKQEGRGEGREPGDGRGAKGERGGSEGKGEGGSGDKEGVRGDGKDKGQRGSGGGSQREGQAGGQSREPQGGEPNSGNRSGEGPSGSRMQPPPVNPPSGFLSRLGGLLEVLKWIVFGLLALLVAFVLLRALLQFLANFTGWARGLLDSLRAFWESLFGRRREDEAETLIEAEAAPAPPPPFSSFANPFRDGGADRLPPEELARYSFSALQAWAYERDLGREPGETPLEFAGRVGEEVPAVEAEARQLALLFARAAYGRGPLPASSREALRQFWQRLETVAEQPLSA